MHCMHKSLQTNVSMHNKNNRNLFTYVNECKQDPLVKWDVLLEANNIILMHLAIACIWFYLVMKKSAVSL